MAPLKFKTSPQEHNFCNRKSVQQSGHPDFQQLPPPVGWMGRLAICHELYNFIVFSDILLPDLCIYRRKTLFKIFPVQEVCLKPLGQQKLAKCALHTMQPGKHSVSVHFKFCSYGNDFERFTLKPKPVIPLNLFLHQCLLVSMFTCVFVCMCLYNMHACMHVCLCICICKSVYMCK